MQQTRRVFRSSIHRRFLKIGQGDGIEAKQLSAVRGKREAAIIALEKKCSFDAPEKKAGEAPGLQGASDAPPMQTTP
ncbi:MAG: hypothetical protein LBF93_13105 [Zoogloeaceae bacterium]|nr:hypothetical protein [Zoogloeaceae bacterium]